MGFGSDGAAVMVGIRNGVAARLLEEISPSLINIHCVAHRLALAIGGAGNKVMKVKFVLEKLDSIYRYYEKSFVRTAGLRSVQEALGIQPVALSQAVVTRWLSYKAAVMSVRKCFPALVLSLSREASERSDVKAHGFYKFVTEWDFIVTLELLAVILPRLSVLSKSLQVCVLET